VNQLQCSRTMKVWWNVSSLRDICSPYRWAHHDDKNNNKLQPVSTALSRNLLLSVTLQSWLTLCLCAMYMCHVWQPDKRHIEKKPYWLISEQCDWKKLSAHLGQNSSKKVHCESAVITFVLQIIVTHSNYCESESIFHILPILCSLHWLPAYHFRENAICAELHRWQRFCWHTGTVPNHTSIRQIYEWVSEWVSKSI